jgi:prefoldin subunit 5
MADIETKLDIILAAIRSIQGELEEVKEQIGVLEEKVTDLGLPGSGYSVFTPEEN